ncbi:MAG: hypothetical protein M3162_02985 [Thermoproteota archaeon]|nr:hypothetical protein [Thermoproteota archaeon]
MSNKDGTNFSFNDPSSVSTTSSSSSSSLPSSSSSLMETPEEKKRRFLIEFENPFKCDKCNERFKKKKYLREHKAEVHAY